MRASAAAKKTIVGSPERRAMTSRVNWAVLGLLIEGAGHGYALRQRFDSVYGGVLFASESHIYKALDGLESRGFIEEVPGSRAVRSGADRRVTVSYRATAEGVRGFRERLFAQVREDRRPGWVFLRQLAVFAREPEVGLRILADLEQAYVEEASRASIASPDDSSMDVVSRLATRLAAEESRLAGEGKLPLIRYARREFEALAADRERKEQ